MEEVLQFVEDVENRPTDPDELEILKYRSQHAIDYLNLKLQESPSGTLNEILVNILAIHQILCREIRNSNSQRRLAVFHVTCKKEKDGIGRPRWNVEAETLISLRSLGFTFIQISEMLLVSRWTIQRRVKEFGIEEMTGYSDISDDELDRQVFCAKEVYGSLAGRSMITGYLQSKGFRVQRSRIMKSLVRVDPGTSRMRWACIIKRRKYSVPGPNSLWHADGHHSLINWGFVIHGAIDGYSRLIVYLNCATNNKKETVLDNFVEAINTFGVPSRLRTDKGGENQLLWEEMESRRGLNRGSYIAGSSVHNQRIERLWRDVWMYVACEYYYTFQALEAEGLLQTDDRRHMYILHYLFKPRINQTIYSFVSGWNKHPLRTEKNWSPEKVWTNGMLDLRNRNLQTVSELHELSVDEDMSWYGYDPHAPCPADIETSDVEVNDLDCPFSAEELDSLTSVSPLRYSTSFGIDIYMELLQLLDLRYSS